MILAHSFFNELFKVYLLKYVTDFFEKIPINTKKINLSSAYCTMCYIVIK